MTTFIPATGYYFYVTANPRIRHVEIHNSTSFATDVKQVIHQDNSYTDEIFLCLARDDTAVIGESKHGSSWGKGKPQLFKIANYSFAPVGPEVLRLLGFGVSIDV